MRLPDFVRQLALRCALLPVPRAARARIAEELEEEYPGIRRQRGAVGARVVVISARAAAEWFGRADAVGEDILVNGTPFEIIGVAPAGFHGPEHPGDAELWVTIGSHDASVPQWGDVLGRTGGAWLHMVGRLGEGVALETARGELAALVQQVAEEFGDDGGGFRRFDVVLTAGTGTFGLRQRAVETCASCPWWWRRCCC